MAFKKSLIRYSRLHVKEIFSRQRKTKKLKIGVASSEEKADAAGTKIWRRIPNPYKTDVGSSHHYSRKLKGAAACLDHDVLRAVPLRMLPKYRNSRSPQLYCNLCRSRGIRQETTWCCLSCGGAFCMLPREWGTNRFPNIISCMDASHQTQMIDQTNLNVVRNQNRD